MTRLLAIGLLATAWLASLSIVVCGGWVEAERIDAVEAGAVEVGIDPHTTGNTASTLGTVEACYKVTCPSAECAWDGSSTFDNVADYVIDVVVTGDTQAPMAYDAELNWDDNIVHIANNTSNPAFNTDVFIKTPGADYNVGQSLPDSLSPWHAGTSYLGAGKGPGIAGNGTLVRVGLDIGRTGLVTFELSPKPDTAYKSQLGIHCGADPTEDCVRDTGMLAINQDCPGVVSTPTPTPTPTSTPGTPTASPTPTPLPTPPPGTILLVGGWNNACYVGPEQPIEDALTGMVDQVLAVYRMRADQGFDAWFPNKPEASSITTVSPYQSLFILVGQYAFWPHEPSGTALPSVPLANGWNSVCYTGQTKSAEDATAGVAGGLAIMYQLGSDQGWSQFVPGRPEVSNIVQLSQYDAVLMLVNQEGGTTWTFDP